MRQDVRKKKPRRKRSKKKREKNRDSEKKENNLKRLIDVRKNQRRKRVMRLDRKMQHLLKQRQKKYRARTTEAKE